jgi:hypothetical protein
MPIKVRKEVVAISPVNYVLLNAASHIDDLLRDTIGRRDFSDVILPIYTATADRFFAVNFIHKGDKQMATYEQKKKVTQQLMEEYNKKIEKLTSSRSVQYRVYCQIVSDLISGEDYTCQRVVAALKTEKSRAARKAYLAFITRRNTLMPL